MSRSHSAASNHAYSHLSTSLYLSSGLTNISKNKSFLQKCLCFLLQALFFAALSLDLGQHSFPFFRLSMCISCIINNISSIFLCILRICNQLFLSLYYLSPFFYQSSKKCLCYIALHFRIVVFLHFFFYDSQYFLCTATY